MEDLEERVERKVSEVLQKEPWSWPTQRPASNLRERLLKSARAENIGVWTATGGIVAVTMFLWYEYWFSWIAVRYGEDDNLVGGSAVISIAVGLMVALVVAELIHKTWSTRRNGWQWADLGILQDTNSESADAAKSIVATSGSKSTKQSARRQALLVFRLAEQEQVLHVQIAQAKENPDLPRMDELRTRREAVIREAVEASLLLQGVAVAEAADFQGRQTLGASPEGLTKKELRRKLQESEDSSHLRERLIQAEAATAVRRLSE